MTVMYGMRVGTVNFVVYRIQICKEMETFIN